MVVYTGDVGGYAAWQSHTPERLSDGRNGLRTLAHVNLEARGARHLVPAITSRGHRLEIRSVCVDAEDTLSARVDVLARAVGGGFERRQPPRAALLSGSLSLPFNSVHKITQRLIVVTP